MKIINYKKNEIIPLTYEENKSYKNQNVCYIRKKEFNTDKNDELIKYKIIVIILKNIEVLLVIFVI